MLEYRPHWILQRYYFSKDKTLWLTLPPQLSSFLNCLPPLLHVSLSKEISLYKIDTVRPYFQ